MTSPAAAANLPELSAVLGVKSVDGQLYSGPGQVVLDDATLSERGLNVGGTVRLASRRGGWRDYRIAGSYRSSYLLRGTVFSIDEAKTLFVSDAPALGYIDLVPGADPIAAQKAVSDLLASNPEVSVLNQTQVTRQAASDVATVEVMVYVLLGLSVIIGVLGIINTMALSILERTRELGLLRAVGMRRSHMVQMVISESLVMAVFGGLLGLAAGIAAGAAFVRVAALRELAVPWTSMGVFLALAALAGLIAALAPSARAAKVNVRAAIAYE